jgi:hypothetical protein
VRLLAKVLAAPLAALAVSACSGDASHAGAVTPTGSRGPDVPRARRPPAPAEWYWDAVEPEVHDAEPHPLDLPLAEAAIARLEGAARLWSELGFAGRDRLRRDGLVVTEPLGDAPFARTRVGAFYSDLRARRIPVVLTVDALYAASLLGIRRAIAAAEAAELGPALHALIAKLGARLAGGGRVAEQELVVPQRLARGLVAVAASLATGAPAPADLAATVAEERARIDAHAGIATSPLLQVPLDYARFEVPLAAASPGLFKAATWLGAAPLVLAARTEPRGGSADVMLARTHTRAAMLLSRLVDRDVDPEISDAYARVARLVAFVWGTPDDLSLVELGDLAEALKVDLAKSPSIASVTRTDLVRHRAALLRPPQVYDGSGGLAKGNRPPASVRVLGGHASPDAHALGTLLTGELAASRPSPNLLDVAAWLGAPGIRSTLREAGASGAPGYDEALARAVTLRPGEDDAARHGSIHASLLDVLLAWAEAKEAGARSVATERARTESLLGAWTLARSEGRPFARAAPAATASSSLRREIDLAGPQLPVFVEPAPDAIAHLLSAVRQANRGLGALGRLDPKGPHRTALAEIEDVLGLALRVATRMHDDDPLSAEDAAALAAVPARLALLEGDLPDADLLASAEVASHPRSGRVLVAAVVGIEPAIVLVKDTARPRTVGQGVASAEETTQPQAVLAVGAHLVLSERVVGRGAGGAAPDELRAPGWLSAFRVTRAVPAKL